MVPSAGVGPLGPRVCMVLLVQSSSSGQHWGTAQVEQDMELLLAGRSSPALPPEIRAGETEISV